MPKFHVRIRVVTPNKQAIYETQVVEAESGLAAMIKAQEDESNTKRGAVSCQGADPFPAEPIIETVGEKPLEFEPEIKHIHDDEPKRRGRPPKHQVVDVE